ncbi:hypothetical protein BB560_003156, partial [Smittium megazygosporum]
MDFQLGDQPTIELLDSLCVRLYESANTEDRNLAEKKLYYYFPSFMQNQETFMLSLGIGSSEKDTILPVYQFIKTPFDSLKHLFWFFELTGNRYSRFYASQRIKVLTLSYAITFSIAELETFGSELLKILSALDNSTERNIISEFSQSISYVLMVGWITSEKTVAFIDTIFELCNHGNYFQQLKGFIVLKIIVQEISREQPAKFIPKQRRMATMFKDNKLKLVFKTAVDKMKSFINDSQSNYNNELLLEVIDLQKEIYLFDFVGLSDDGSEDDILSVQIPAGWRDSIDAIELVKFLELLSYFSSIRRTFLTDDTRQKFVELICTNIVDIIDNEIHMEMVDNFHQMSRLLSRFCTIHTFTELESKPIYFKFLASALKFTIKGFSSWEEYETAKTPEDKKIVTEIKSAIKDVITNYLLALISAASNNYIQNNHNTDPLDNEEDIFEQLNHLATMARLHYQEAVSILMQAMNNFASQYQNALSADSYKQEEIELPEIQLSWLINVVSAFLNAKKRNPRHSRMFIKLSTILGEIDTTQCLDIIIQRVIYNLDLPGCNTAVLMKSLDLFYELSVGYNSVRQITNISSIQNLLKEDRLHSLGFLATTDIFKLREKYYASAIRIIAVSEKFDDLLKSFLEVWGNEIESFVQICKLSRLEQEDYRKKFMHLLQSIRGCLSSISSRDVYKVFFSWIFPRHLESLYNISFFSCSDPGVLIAFLKLVREFVTNKSQRITFDVSSPNGILVFQIISKILFQTEETLRAQSGCTDNRYKRIYKPAAICYDILNKIFSGRYVAIGVMPIYNDSSLDIAFTSIFELANIVPTEFVSNNIHLIYLTLKNLEKILLLCSIALQSPIASISSLASSILEHMFVYTFEYQSTGKYTPELENYAFYFQRIENRAPICKLLSGNDDIQRKFLKQLYDKILFEENQNEWSLSRPLFALATLQKEYFYYYSSLVVQHQPESIREQLTKSIGGIVNSINSALKPDCKDKFTQAITQYKRDITNNNINLVLPTTQNKSQAVVDFTDPLNDSESQTTISGLGRRVGQLDAGQTENAEYQGTKPDQSPHGTEASPPRYAGGSPPEGVSYLK